MLNYVLANIRLENWKVDDLIQKYTSAEGGSVRTHVVVAAIPQGFRLWRSI